MGLRLEKAPLRLNKLPPIKVYLVGSTATFLDLWSKHKTFKWDEGVVEEVIEKGKFFSIRNVNLVTTLEVSTLRVYAREETCRIWADLVQIIEKPQERRVCFVGCPGTGKTILAWHFAYHLARKLRKQVVWFSSLRSLDAEFAVLSVKAEEIEYMNACSFDIMRSAMEHFGNDTVIFIDGVRPAHQPVVNVLYEWWFSKMAPLIQLQSMPLHFRQGTVASLEIARRWDEVYYHRWTIQEFVEALRGDAELKARVLPKLEVDDDLAADSNVSIVTDEALQTLIEKKAYYAGFSARSMFDLTVKQIKEELDLALSRVSAELLKLWTVDGLLTLESTVRDSLLVKEKDEQLSNKCEPASAYVLVQLCLLYSIEVHSMMRLYVEHLDKNAPVLKGCVFEKYFRCVLQECLSHDKHVTAFFFDGLRTAEKWNVSKILECPLKDHKVAGLINWVPDPTTDDYLWIDPVGFNNNGWNFAQYVKKDSLFRAVQLTVGKEHKRFGYGDVAKWVESLKGRGCTIEKCEYVYLHPVGYDPPTIPKAEVDDGLFRSEGDVQSRTRFGKMVWL